ncbi:transglycosylase domain-containing protein [Rhizobium sp. SL86]|uniref:transglycosylase domain-containing protein n=1 Tax=Rhizobium sp. SL86 TaxID=2995148 RepID=UPI002275E678|nr:transglycosylase domain-containing protein [Rhizobium sp. SL86]MCY1665195.1 transglycosylase domain-containing protein [Rhizobium sp. SL86]
MASGSRSRRRVDPSFDDERPSDDDLVIDASDRIIGNGGRRPDGRKQTAERPGAERELRSNTRKRKRRSGGGLFGAIRSLIYWCIVLGIWAGIGIGGLVLYYGAQMPAASTWTIPNRPPNVKIAALDGTLIANRGTTGGEAIALEEMSPFLPQAVMAIEDRRFYSHFGVDPLGLARAFVNNLLGESIQGGSTITQQLAKNLFLSPDRTFERKIQEVLLSFWLEHKFTKDQILAMYLNRMFFGSNAYGVEAASQRYFKKSARDVNLAEAATLAGLLKAPTRLSPARDPQAAEARAQVVLGAMREEGYITEEEVKTAMSQPPTKARSYWSGAEHYAADMVMDEVKSLIGEVKSDITVQTTLDMRLEKDAEKALTDVLSKEGGKLNASQAALVSIDATGAIRAVVGGRDYAQSQFNRAFKAKRQPGSAFKPFVYAAAVEAGYRPDTVMMDRPVKIGTWTPENYEDKYQGPVPLAKALAESLNTVAAQLVMQVGPKTVISMAHRLGIESDMQANASIALGTSEVSLVELTSAYAPFMNGGLKATPHLVTRITDADGKVLYDADFSSPPRVLSEQVVATMNGMLNGVLTQGTGKAARLAHWQAAGKTGTTQSFRDAIFVGYTSTLTTGVWFGNDDGTPMKKVTGGNLPAKAWKEYMTAALDGYRPTPLLGVGVQPAPPPGETQSPTIGDIISGVFSGHSTNDYPAAPEPPQAAPSATVSQGQAVAPPAGLPQNGDYRDYREYRPPGGDRYSGSVPPADVGGGPVPPADVGGPSGSPQQRHTTLLDIIMGQ